MEGDSMKEQTKVLVSVAEASEALSLSERSVREYAYRKILKSVTAGRRLLIPQTELQRVAKEGLPSLRARASES